MAFNHTDRIWEPDDRTIIFDTRSQADFERLQEIARARGLRVARRLDGTGFAMLYKSDISNRADKVEALRSQLQGEGLTHISVR